MDVSSSLHMFAAQYGRVQKAPAGVTVSVVYIDWLLQEIKDTTALFSLEKVHPAREASAASKKPTLGADPSDAEVHEVHVMMEHCTDEEMARSMLEQEEGLSGGSLEEDLEK